MDEIDSLRSRQVVSSAAASLLARVVQFVGTAVIVRMVIRSLGTDSWGILAMLAAMAGLAVMLDLSLQELTLFQTATARTRSEFEDRVGQVLTLSLLPALSGTLLLGGLVWWGPAWFPQAGISTSDLRSLLASVAVGFLLTLPACVWAGALQGLGWIRELNWTLTAEALFDLIAVALCLWTDQDLVTLQWARTARVIVRWVLLAMLLHALGVPQPAPRQLREQSLRPMVRWAAGYSVSRGLGLFLYRAPVLLSSVWLPPALVGALAAADQWASLAYRASHLFYESLFHRFARFLQPDAPKPDRQLGQRQLVGWSTALAAIVTAPGVGLALLGPWLFQKWVGISLPQAAEALPPLTGAWVLNAACSLSTCALLALGRSGASIRAHLLACGVLALVAVFAIPTHGIVGAAVAALAANLVLAAALFPPTALAAGIGWGRLALPPAAILGTGLVAWFGAGLLSVSPLWQALAGGAAAAVAAGLIVTHQRDLLELRRAQASDELSI